MCSHWGRFALGKVRTGGGSHRGRFALWGGSHWGRSALGKVRTGKGSRWEKFALCVQLLASQLPPARHQTAVCSQLDCLCVSWP